MDKLKRGIATALAAGALLLAPLGARAADGELDATFGTGGIAVTGDIAWNTPAFGGLGAQSDGGYAIGGAAPNQPWEIRRFLADGSIDTAFGSGGGTLFSGFDARDLRALAITADDGILAGGRANLTVTTGTRRKARTTTRTLGAVERFTSTGLPDASFGSGGIAWLDVPGSSGAGVLALAVLENGAILVAGAAFAPPPGKNYAARQEIFVARLTAQGTLDSSFGTNGYFVYDPNNAKTGALDNEDLAVQNGLAVLSDGRIAVGARTIGNTTADRVSRLILLTPDGVMLDEITRSGGLPWGVTVDAEDRIVVPESVSTWAGNQVLVRRFLTPSSGLRADTSFGTSGEVMIALPDYDHTQVLAPARLTSTGEIVLAVDAWAAAPGALARTVHVVRLDESGQLDPAFGSGGVSAPIAPMHDQVAFGCFVDASDRVVVSGHANLAAQDATTSDWVWFVARL